MQIRLIMTREEEKNMARFEYVSKRLANPDFPTYNAEYELESAFDNGALWADAHPHWISVEDELPPRWETNPNVSVPVITFGTLSEINYPCVELQRYHFGDGRWLYGKATHWMPYQSPKKGSEK